jgi:fructose-1,6-bisphosphatase II
MPTWCGRFVRPAPGSYCVIDGDAEGAMIAATVDTGVDALMGIGGATQGILSACVVKSVGGEMLARIAPQSAEERGQIVDAGLDFRRIMTTEDMVKGRQIFFAVTGITATALLEPMHFYRNYATTHSMLIRAETGTRRFILAEHAMRVREGGDGRYPTAARWRS